VKLKQEKKTGSKEQEKKREDKVKMGK